MTDYTIPDLDEFMVDALEGEPERRLLFQMRGGLAALQEHGLQAPELERHYEETWLKIHRQRRGPAARSPKEMDRHGVIAASVQLLRESGCSAEKARAFVAETSGVDRDELRKILHAVKHAPEVVGAYNLTLQGATRHYLNELSKLSKSTTPRQAIADMFAEASN